MLPKPEECRGCPMYQDGKGFVPDEYREGARVLVLGQNPGKDEEREGRPFIGASGKALEGTYLPLAGLTREDVSIANVLRCRWENTDNLPLAKVLNSAITHCTRAYFKPPASTELIIALGDLSRDAMGGGKRGFTK